MLSEANKTRLVEIARNPDSAPGNRVDACKLIYKCGILPASEVTSILQQTIDNYRSKDNIIIKAINLMNEIDNSTGQEKELSPEQREIVEKSLMEQYLECPSEQS